MGLGPLNILLRFPSTEQDETRVGLGGFWTRYEAREKKERIQSHLRFPRLAKSL